MGEKMEVGCARPTGGPVGSPPLDEAIEGRENIEKEVTKVGVQVGKKAPDFQAPAFYECVVTFQSPFPDRAGQFPPGDQNFCVKPGTYFDCFSSAHKDILERSNK